MGCVFISRYHNVITIQSGWWVDLVCLSLRIMVKCRENIENKEGASNFWLMIGQGLIHCDSPCMKYNTRLIHRTKQEMLLWKYSIVATPAMHADIIRSFPPQCPQTSPAGAQLFIDCEGLFPVATHTACAHFAVQRASSYERSVGLVHTQVKCFPHEETVVSVNI